MELRAWVVGGILLGLSGCSLLGASRTVGKGSVQGIFEGLSDLDPALPKKALAALTGDADLKKQVHDLVEAAVAGAADGAGDPEVEKRLDRLVASLMDTLGRSGDASLKQLLETAGPELARMLRTALAGAIGEVRTARKELDAAARGLVKTSVDSFFAALDDNAGRAGKSLAPVVGEVAHTAAKEAVVGLQAGLDAGKLRELARAAGEGLTEGLEAGAGRDGGLVKTIVTSVAVALGFLFLLAVAGLVALWRHYSQSTKSLAIAAEKINELTQTNEKAGRDLKKRIAESAQRNRVDNWMSNFLKRRGL